jgi:hypothetical protein
MPEFEFEFNQQDKDLVISQNIDYLTDDDYVRLTIYPTEAINNIVDLPNSDNGIDGQAIFFSSLSGSVFYINISPFKEDNIFDTISIGGSDNDFKIYKNETTQDIYIKPNEIFNDFELPQGNYKIQIDFLNQVTPDVGGEPYYKFIIKQVSTSRKEVRLKILDEPILNNSDVITNITNKFNLDTVGNNTDNYQFKHVLNIGTGDHIPIMNYMFDAVTDGKDNQSIILKLYEPLPTTIGDLSMVTIEKEVLTTQLQEIFYFSDVPDIFFGDGLNSQPQEDWINPDNNDFSFQSLDELAYSASIGDIEIDSLISSSEYGYPNLNTDFNEFTNHTFFGSAKKKLENFKTKVETIQEYYSEISSSLVVSSSIEGDSSFVIQKRKDLFNKINDEIKTFTPYERFLYFDGQSESTASAPGLGKNYASTTPLHTGVSGDNYEELNQHDGFNVVYKHSRQGDFVQLVSDQYYAHRKPFFNYSGSIYLSFLAKGNVAANQPTLSDTAAMTTVTHNGLGYPLPVGSKGSTIVSRPNMTGSEYRRYIYQTSHSYWIPNNAWSDDTAHITDFSLTSNQLTILDGSVKTGSYQIKDSNGVYPTTVVTQSGAPFFGSVMPAGNLFRLTYTSDSSAVTQSFVTDVKVTLNDPSDVFPFDNIYHTSSTEWTNWYNGMYDSASAFDTDNIHSFENNLPLYIQNSSEYNDMKDFLNLQGEQYDLIRNHIDSMGTLHKRGYKKTNSPPDNTLPMLLSNMGWQPINPISGSLTETLGNYLTSVTSFDDIKNNTWRKTLNNLLYIYKSKGTKNSVRGLLNTYGYPPDVLQFQEFGGTTSEGNQIIFTNNEPSSSDINDLSLNNEVGIFSFTNKKEKLYNYKFSKKHDRKLNLDWWMDSANINSFQFVYKHSNTTNTQTILESSGSGNETLWDLRLIPSSDGVSSSFEFRLNNSKTGSLTIASNAVSMSTNYSNISDGQLWNVMLQRMTGSTSTNIVNEYRLHTSLQDGETIKTYNYVTMSVSGAAATDSNNIANQNFMGSGSRHQDSSSNLFIGETFSGSMAEVRGWSTALSTSKFRQHTLNKLSTVGNTINSHKDELIYHFKLNENYTTASVSASGQNLTIVDSSPTTTYSDYSFTKSGDVFTGSLTYGFDYTNNIRLTLEDNNNKQNDNTILINPKRTVVGDLNPNKSAVKSIHLENSKPLFKTSVKLELYRSPQTYVDNFILDNLGGFNLETLYGNPVNYYSQSYDEFDTFRKNFFEAHPIEVDVNKFIRAHENMFNHSLSEGIKSIIPGRSTFSDKNSNFGVEIKPTILEKQKYENEKHSVESNPNTFTASISPSPVLSNSEFVQPKTGSISVNVTNITTYEQPKSASISVNVTNTTTYERPKSGSISASPSLNSSTYEPSKNGTIDYALIANESFEDVHKNWGTSSADVHFINYFYSGSDNNYNTYDIEKKAVFHTIGDSEYYSASRGNSSNFDNSSRFYNRLMIDTDFHADVSYESLIGGTNTNQTGRMMGKTRYFITGSNGEITLPRNHITKFSYPFKEQMVNGAQNTNPGFLNVQHEDYSSASFYRVKVTGGENSIYVKGENNPTISGEDKIIY